MTSLPWLRIDTSMSRHPKADLLDAALGERRTWSYVVELWMWVAEHRPDGSLAGIPDVIIARRAGYDGDGARFVAALIECGWLDVDRTLHGWHERQGARAEKAQRDADRKKERRADGARTARGQDAPSAERRADGALPFGDGTERDGTERNETRSRGVPGSDGVPPRPQPAPPAPRAIEPVRADRPEPLGPYGEVMPKTVPEILDFVFEKRSLRERWERDHPPLAGEPLERAVAAALVHRMTLDGHRFRGWFWPNGFVHKVDDWLRRERRAVADVAGAEARAAKAGVHVVTSDDEAAAARAKARTRAATARFDGQHPADDGLGPIDVGEVMRRARAGPSGGVDGSGATTESG